MSELFDVPFHSLQSGDIAVMLKESYREWSEYDRWVNQWIAYDAEIFEHPDTVGRCGFATRTGGNLIGFMSWDPRSRPCATIGHNCILPPYRNHGYGSWQVQRAIEVFRERGFTQARVSTGVDSFFAASRRMYEKNGFQRCEPFIKTQEAMVFYTLEIPRNS